MTLDPSQDTASNSVDDSSAAIPQREEAAGDGGTGDGSIDASRRPICASEATAVIPRVRGYIDVIDGPRIGGWAYCTDQPERPVEVEIRRGAQALATVRADRHRLDLHRLGIGTGHHGFEVSLEESIPFEERDRISAHVRLEDTAEWTSLPNAALSKPPQPGSAMSVPAEGWREALETVRRDLVAQLHTASLELKQLYNIQRTTKHSACPSEAAISREVVAQLATYVDKLKELAAAQAAATEMLQTRADVLLASIKASDDGLYHSKRHDRILHAVVIALGALSLVSLAVGIFSVLA